MSVRSILAFLTMFGLCLLIAGNLGGCPIDLCAVLGCAEGGGEEGGGEEGEEGGGEEGGGEVEKTLHEQILTEILPDGYEGTRTCLNCHADHALDILDTAHWKWAGPITQVVNPDGSAIAGEHGKLDLINNFCIAVPSNEGRCTQCHPSYGFTDNTFDLTDIENMDCLVCHDTSGAYKKHPSANGGGGQPALMIDGELTVVGPEDLQEVAYSVGPPTRQNCGACHFYAGGGDNVKVGTLSSDLVDPTYEMDVHMGSTDTGGLDFACQDCHTEADHGIAGMVFHSVDEGGAKPNCTRCHGDRPHSASDALGSLLNLHTGTVACETCHIPTFSRSMATKTAWYWDEAGEDRTDIPTQEGRPTYNKKKGSFVWEKDVTPTYMWYDGNWERRYVGISDTYDNAGTEEDPVVLAKPTAEVQGEGAKIYPFKKMIGRQVADPVNKRLMVPHLFGTANGDNPYWGTYDWTLAVQDGAAYTGQPFSGTIGFVNTVMYLRVSHEVAPKDEALTCEECHGNAAFWEQVGIEDPFGF